MRASAGAPLVGAREGLVHREGCILRIWGRPRGAPLQNLDYDVSDIAGDRGFFGGCGIGEGESFVAADGCGAAESSQGVWDYVLGAGEWDGGLVVAQLSGGELCDSL